MSENSNPLNDFLETEDSKDDIFSSSPFDLPAAEAPTENQETLAEPVEASAFTPKEMTDIPCEQPTQNAACDTPSSVVYKSEEQQTTMFESAMLKTPTPPPVSYETQIENANDPFAAALAHAKAQSDERLLEGLTNRDAFFVYGKAKDPITDKDATFEDLRKKYEDDFPEFSESKKVEWSVIYGKETKVISNPGSDKVYDIKSEIEKSDKFLASIKKGKTDADKKPECIVKPRIKAQSKGKVISLSSYKEFCTDIDEANKSNKAIILLPSSDGRLYQIRKTPIGNFVATVDNIPEFEDISTGFEMTLPKIPLHILMFVWDFFAKLSERYELEALVHILYDTKRNKYTIRVPKQKLTHTSVNSVLDEDYPEHMIHVMDIHSHNTMPAKFSQTDNNDERATRLYAVIGRLLQLK